MPRTVVYDSPSVQIALEPQAEKSSPRRAVGPSTRDRRDAHKADTGAIAARDAQRAAELPVKDDYTSKIAKYVPAEVISVSAAGFAAFDPSDSWVWIAIVIGASANILYLFATAVTLPITARPRLYFYVLSILGFLAWAIATIPQVREEFGLNGTNDAEKAAYVLAAAAFGLPLLDTALDRLEVGVRDIEPAGT